MGELIFRVIYSSWALLRGSEKARLLALMLARLIVNGLDILGVLLFGAVGVLAVGQRVEIPAIGLAIEPDDLNLVPLLVSVAALFVAKTLLALSLSRKIFAYLASVESRFSRRIVNRIFSEGLSQVKRYSRAETEWAVLRSSAIAFSTVLGQAITLVSEVTLAFGVLVVLFFADASVAFALTGYLLILGLILQLWSSKLVKNVGEQFSDQSVATNNALDDLVVAYREIAIAGKLPPFIDSVATHRAAVSAAQAKYGFLTSVPRYIAESGLVIAVIGLVALFGGGATGGLGMLAVFAAGGLRILSAMLPLLRAFQDLRYHGPLASAAQEIMAELKNQHPLEASDANGVENGSIAAHEFAGEPLRVEVSGLFYSYEDRPGTDGVLRNVSLSVESGEIVALVGPSGAGKSTLSELILGLHSPSAGQVLLGGVPATQVVREKPGIIGYVPQKPGLISGSIERNIVMGNGRETIDQVGLLEAIEFAGLGPLIKSLPEGLQTELGKHRDALSGGQLQRIGLARALYRNPQLIILDEATSALDAESETFVSRKILGLREKITVIVVAHRLSSIQGVDRIYLLDGGKVVASGTFLELYNSTKLMKRYADLMRINLPADK